MRHSVLFFALFFVISIAILSDMTSPTHAQGADDDFDSIALYELENKNGMQVNVTNYGAIITSIVVPDRDGNMADVALGYDNLKSYINAADKPYFGAVVGRYGNRIANGKFTIAGEEYTLQTNNGENHLHGGNIGFDKVVWDALPTKGDGFVGVKLTYASKDGEEGYPGNLLSTVEYQLTDKNQIVVEYIATTDKPTPINLTQHTYFNLKGEGDGDILGHVLMIDADQYTPVDAGSIPNGGLARVEGTPFDFRTAKPIGRDINVKHEQLEFGRGFDHNWVVNESDGTKMKLAATVYEPTTGRRMEVHTQEPGVQFYCGNFLKGDLIGKSGRHYVHRGGFCLETQHFPDSPNQPEFPSTLLKPGETYQTRTSYTFSTR